MEVYFLDVGQGTCQVLLLGGRRAIVIDCGSKTDHLALQFLKRVGVEYVVRLIVSHSHEDHIGGANSILGEYQDRIEKICFVQDDLLLESLFWARITEFLKSGVLRKDQLVRLERTNKPQLVWNDPTAQARLRTYSPAFAENLAGQAARQPNPTSAVLFFDCGVTRIAFAADSDVAQWREIRTKAGKPIVCNVLAVPHHAGHVALSQDDLTWLFAEAVQPQFAVISVGTSNTHGHPNQAVIQALRRRGALVMCTQITAQCCRDLEALRPGVLQPVQLLGRSSDVSDLTPSGNSRNLACAGTVLAHVTPSQIRIERSREHQVAVDELAKKAHASPLCRP